MSYTSNRIARLEALLSEIDTALESLAGGIEAVQVGQKSYRYSQRKDLEHERARIEGDLSMLQALTFSGGRTFARRGRI